MSTILNFLIFTKKEIKIISHDTGKLHIKQRPAHCRIEIRIFFLSIDLARQNKPEYYVRKCVEIIYFCY